MALMCYEAPKQKGICTCLTIKEFGGITMLEIIIIIASLAASIVVYPKFVKKFGEMK